MILAFPSAIGLRKDPGLWNRLTAVPFCIQFGLSECNRVKKRSGFTESIDCCILYAILAFLSAIGLRKDPGLQNQMTAVPLHQLTGSILVSHSMV